MSSAGFPSDFANYSDLFRRMLDCVFLLDPQSFMVLDANPIAESILKSDRSELAGKPFDRWIHPDEHPKLHQSMRVSRRRYHPRKEKFRWILPSGETRIMELMMCGLKLRDERNVLQVVCQDITVEHEASEKLKELNTKLEALAITDGLTQLANYRYFKARHTQEHHRAQRYGGSYCVLFCDVDFFKQYNDQNGHQAGDLLLFGIGQLLQKACRGSDLPARYGGEEFIILCPETEANGAMVLAERIRTMVEKSPFPHAQNQPHKKVTISIGIASFPDCGKTEEEILQSADAALYRSKQTGRNRITTAGPI